MKKADAVDQLERAGTTIHSLNASAWNTALHPTKYGWLSSALSVVSIPVLSAASLGHVVSSAVVNQINPDTFERITTLGAEPGTGATGKPGDTK
jgi:hypothetical protein